MKVVSYFDLQENCFVCDDGNMFGIGTLEKYDGEFSVSKRAWDGYLAWCKANLVEPSRVAPKEPSA